MLLAVASILAEVEQGKGAGGGGLDSFFFLFLPLLLFVFFIILPMRREAKSQRMMRSALKKGDRVLINGFLIASVVQINKSESPQVEDDLLVKVDDNANIKMRVLRGSVTRIIPASEPAKDAKEGS